MSSIITLIYKDDSFRSLNWTSLSGSITTNGDEIFIPAGVVAVRTSQSILGPTIGNIDIMARTVSTTPLLNLALYNTSSSLVFSSSIIPTSTTYNVYTINVSTMISASIVSTIELTSATDQTAIDFIAFEQVSGTNLNVGGMTFTINIDKKTFPQPIPLTSDVVQQIGILSRTLEVDSPKLPRSYYNTLEVLVISNTPVLLSAPSQSATGYLTQIRGVIEAGTIPPLYDLTINFVKADNIFP